MTKSRFILVFVFIMILLPLGVSADHTASPASVTLVGSLQDELGCPGDWQADCAATYLTFNSDDDVWQDTFNVPAGSWEYKAALNDSWDENYGAGGVAGGDNIVLSVADPTDVKFYYDHKSHWVTDDVNSVIATVPGSFQSALGCPGDWQPDCLRSWMQDADADGIYTFSTDQIPAGSYEFKVALDEAWDISFPAANVPFTSADGDVVTFTYESTTNNVSVSVEEPPPPGPASVTIVGSLQSELGCPSDWQPDCAATHLTYDGDDDVWQGIFNVPAGSWEYKAALNDSWDENYGAGAQRDGPNIPLSLANPADVKLYYDHKSHWVTDAQNSIIATVPGSFQSALGCPGDWQPDCLRSWLQDIDGDGIYNLSTNAIPAGDYEAKVTINESWDENYGEGGVPGGPNIPFTVPEVTTVDFEYDSITHVLTINTRTGGLEPGDEDLVRPVQRTDFTNNIFYFVLPDRFDNGDVSNDTGGDLSGDPLVNGFMPTDKGYYHGGDLTGLMGKLAYLDDLGVSAIWMTPQFTNRWVQGDGTIGGSSAAYHGYWQIDYTQIDAHFGSNAEMVALINAAHGRGMKVFFDVVINHTGDVISYEEGVFTYRNKDDFPYQDANGNPFDDRDFAGGDMFPPLDPAVSFPYSPTYLTPEDAAIKSPAWMNNPIYYHNRGDSTFVGENSLYGDFFGLDDMFTEHPDVVNGMIEAHKNMITEFGVDGFRVDTVKHVNDELWEKFVPEILAHAEAQGNPDFTLFGEVFSGDPGFTSRYTTSLPFPSVLDFGFDGAAKGFASASLDTDNLAAFFANDDYFTDADSNAHALVKFIGNHDIGRLGFDIDTSNPGAADSERVARSELAYALMFFSRGVPLIYYGDEQGFTGDGGDKDARQDMMPSLVPSYNDDDLIGTDATTAEANFDPTHPLYQTFSDFAAIRDAHLALSQGAQLNRYSEGEAGIYTFSRIDRTEKIEYVVVLNNSQAADTATFGTDSPDTTFTEIYPGLGPGLASDADGNLTVVVPGLAFVIYVADSPIPSSSAAPGILIETPEESAEVTGRFEVRAALDDDTYAEVTFAVSVDGGEYKPIGTDDNAPYRVFYDTSSLPAGTMLTFKAIVDDLAGNLNANKVSVVVGEEAPPPSESPTYAVIHYLREDGDYGDHTTGDFNNFWGLHLWEEIDEAIEWTAPKPFLGEDDYGRFAWVKLAPNAQNVGFIVHRGDTKDGTSADRFFNPSLNPEIWLKSDDADTYSSQAEAQGFVTIRYHRPDGTYDGWGLHLWGDAIDPSEATTWDNPKMPDGFDEYGAFFNIQIQDATQPVNFIVHKGDDKDPMDSPDRSFIPVEMATIWLKSGDVAVYPQRGAAENFATLHYYRADGDYGDPTSPDFNDFWGLHVWTGAASPNPGWTDPLRWDYLDTYGPAFTIPLLEGASELGYIIHRGETKDPGPDQFLVLDKWGYEVWQLEGEGPDPDQPHYVLPILAAPGANPGNIGQQRAYWVSVDTIAWAAGDSSSNTYTLQYAPEGGLEATRTGIEGGDSITLTPYPAGLPGEVKAKFPHLADLPALKISAEDLALVPEVLKGQIAVSSVNAESLSVDATGLQIPGVLDDLYNYQGELGVSWDGEMPTIRLWAPTAKSVNLHLFDDADPTTTSTSSGMTLDPLAGVWSIAGNADWKNKFYLFEVEVYVHTTGQVENNLVTDPYSISLSMNSARSQLVDLSDAALEPEGWNTLEKPPLPAPEDISIYEIQMRDFSANDPLVPDELKGTFKAFTLEDTYGMDHLEALTEAGLTHLHLLPVFDIATINEDKAEWQAPDPAVLATYPPDSDQQQAAVTSYEDLDGFNWGYDPFHYTTPEGSYSTDPDGAARIVEFRQMVQSLNQMGLRVVMDVVYNHTNASGQNEKSVLDRIVPGYYHRLDDQGQVETSTCCQNTASEHNMMGKLMVDSLVTWAKYYKIDAFRFDLMGHHMVSNMEAVRAALDGLTLEEDGVEGTSIYIYGEGWNFGEVADNARGVNATQLNMAGTGIATFSDRQRDAVRGGGPFDSGNDLVQRQGFANGLFYDPNALNSGSAAELDTLLLLTDQIRVGMAGNLAGYQFIDRNGNLVTGADVDYNGQPAGYTADPQEDITYISKHDNQTLYDNNTFKAPFTTSMADRVRMQNVGLSTVLLGQGVPFMHAGSDLLRSKSFDRDSFNSGDWFNKLDFTYASNNYGVGLPVAGKNQDNWPIMQPLLADSNLKPELADIQSSAWLYQELLRIRYSSPLFRLQTYADIQERVEFHNTGPNQLPGLIVMSISDQVETDLDRAQELFVVLINANDEAQTFTLHDLAGFELALHLVQVNSVDDLVKTSQFDSASGTFIIPGRTTAVFEYAPQEMISSLIDEIEALMDAGILNGGQANALIVKLETAIKNLEKDKVMAALNNLNAFINQVQSYVGEGLLTPEQGQSLIEAAEAIREQIQDRDQVP